MCGCDVGARGMMGALIRVRGSPDRIQINGDGQQELSRSPDVPAGCITVAWTLQEDHERPLFLLSARLPGDGERVGRDASPAPADSRGVSL